MALQTLKIGTRGSPLALIQTEMVQQALASAHPHILTERVIIKTSGDWKPEDGETKLCEARGGKGLFAHELENALQDGSIDCAVHSMKDMPSFLPDGLVLDHVLERGDPRDAFISYKASSLMELPQGAVVGTSSARRQSFLLTKRPDIKVVPLRGNVHTRLDKLKDGQVDATFLAMAGLVRLGIHGNHIHAVETRDMLPASCQAAIGIEIRKKDAEIHVLLDSIHDEQTGLCCFAERAALQILDGSCHTPIGAYARFEGGKMLFNLALAALDGSQIFEQFAEMPISKKNQAIDFGSAVAGKLKTIAPANLLV